MEVVARWGGGRVPETQRSSNGSTVRDELSSSPSQSSSSAPRMRRASTVPDSKYTSSEDMIHEMIAERKRSMFLSRDGTFEDFQRRLQGRQSQDEKLAELADDE